MAYPLELKVQARTLYVEGGLTYEEVADETGVSLSQLKEWGKDQEWGKEKQVFEARFFQMFGHLQKAKVELAEKAAHGDTNAANNLMGLMKHEKGQGVNASTIGRSILAELLNFVITKHLDAFEQVGGLLLAFLDEANPEVLRLKSWQRKELRDKIQSSVGKVGALATKKSLDPETLKKIREEVYGIVDASA